MASQRTPSGGADVFQLLSPLLSTDDQDEQLRIAGVMSHMLGFLRSLSNYPHAETLISMIRLVNSLDAVHRLRQGLELFQEVNACAGTSDVLDRLFERKGSMSPADFSRLCKKLEVALNVFCSSIDEDLDQPSCSSRKRQRVEQAEDEPQADKDAQIDVEASKHDLIQPHNGQPMETEDQPQAGKDDQIGLPQPIQTSHNGQPEQPAEKEAEDDRPVTTQADSDQQDPTADKDAELDVQVGNDRSPQRQESAEQDEELRNDDTESDDDTVAAERPLPLAPGSLVSMTLFNRSVEAVGAQNIESLFSVVPAVEELDLVRITKNSLLKQVLAVLPRNLKHLKLRFMTYSVMCAIVARCGCHVLVTREGSHPTRTTTILRHLTLGGPVPTQVRFDIVRATLEHAQELPGGFFNHIDVQFSDRRSLDPLNLLVEFCFWHVIRVQMQNKRNLMCFRRTILAWANSSDQQGTRDKLHQLFMLKA